MWWWNRMHCHDRSLLHLLATVSIRHTTICRFAHGSNNIFKTCSCQAKTCCFVTVVAEWTMTGNLGELSVSVETSQSVSQRNKSPCVQMCEIDCVVFVWWAVQLWPPRIKPPEAHLTPESKGWNSPESAVSHIPNYPPDITLAFTCLVRLALYRHR